MWGARGLFSSLCCYCPLRCTGASLHPAANPERHCPTQQFQDARPAHPASASARAMGDDPDRRGLGRRTFVFLPVNRFAIHLFAILLIALVIWLLTRAVCAQRDRFTSLEGGRGYFVPEGYTRKSICCSEFIQKNYPHALPGSGLTSKSPKTPTACNCRLHSMNRPFSFALRLWLVYTSRIVRPWLRKRKAHVSCADTGERTYEKVKLAAVIVFRLYPDLVLQTEVPGRILFWNVPVSRSLC